DGNLGGVRRRRAFAHLVAAAAARLHHAVRGLDPRSPDRGRAIRGPGEVPCGRGVDRDRLPSGGGGVRVVERRGWRGGRDAEPDASPCATGLCDLEPGPGRRADLRSQRAAGPELPGPGRDRGGPARPAARRGGRRWRAAARRRVLHRDPVARGGEERQVRDHEIVPARAIATWQVSKELLPMSCASICISGGMAAAARGAAPFAARARRGQLLAPLAALILVAPGARAAGVYYVGNSSASCSDAGAGTQTQPYCTITAALAGHHDGGTTI